MKAYFFLMIPMLLFFTPGREMSGTMNASENVVKENPKAKKHGEIACKVMDSGGNTICLGKRCTAPTGTCKYQATCKCETPSSKGSLQDGMSYEEFVVLWNNPITREELLRKGFYEEDIK